MTGRFEWERALRAAPGMPWHVKAFLLYIGTYMSADGRNARPSVARIVRETGLSRSRVFELLQAGEAAGWLRTVPEKGKTSLRLPTVPTGDTDPSDLPDPSDTPDPSTGAGGPTHRTGGSDTPDGGGPTHRTQQSHLQHTYNSSLRAADDLDQLAAETGATRDEIETLIEETHRDRPDVGRPVAYLRALQRNGDLDDRLAELRAEQFRARIAAELHTARRDPAMRCHHGTDAGLYIRPDTGTSPCALCRHEALRAS